MIGLFLAGILAQPLAVPHAKPLVAWRGVHLFVGPNALEFHKKLWTRVLLPLGFNKVVLQCEQTEWRCLPNLRGGINMKRDDLRKLCTWYRSVGVEVIPLVQSLGHTQWLCQGGKNKAVMINPEVPFTVDPQKPEVRRLYTKLWAEVIAVTKPKTVHFGLDEIAFRGMPKDPARLTRLWKLQVPILAAIARKHKVGFMLWGDQILGPGEGAPPAGGGTLADAKARRSVLPKGAYVCDWHYQNVDDPDPYKPSLTLLCREGFRPIAASWYRPKNILGQTRAAISTRSGVLQTIWAGYESSEKSMMGNLKQFSALVLASDAAWGRTPTADPRADLLARFKRG